MEPASFSDSRRGLPFLDKMPTGMLYFTGLMELIGGALITIGLFTRPVAFVLSGFMAFAYFMAHFPRSFFPAINGGERGGALLFRLPVSRRRRPRALGDREELTGIAATRRPAPSASFPAVLSYGCEETAVGCYCGPRRSLEFDAGRLAALNASNGRPPNSRAISSPDSAAEGVSPPSLRDFG